MQRLSFLTSTLLATTAVAVFAPIASANPFTGHYEGWNYVKDSATDSTGGRDKYEIFGMAFKQVGNTLSFAINSNMAIGGSYSADVADKNIGYGDLILKFADVQFGVRFAESNDSGVSGTGVYSNITTKDVTQANSGYSSLQSYYNAKPNARFYGDARDAAFFANTAERQAGNSLASGTKIADLVMLGADQVLDFSAVFNAAFNGAGTGAHTFGFSFERTDAMSGDFLAEVLLECINDGVAIDSSDQDYIIAALPEDVTEPADDSSEEDDTVTAPPDSDVNPEDVTEPADDFSEEDDTVTAPPDSDVNPEDVTEPADDFSEEDDTVTALPESDVNPEDVTEPADDSSEEDDTVTALPESDVNPEDVTEPADDSSEEDDTVTALPDSGVNPEDVPEPASTLGLLAVAALGAAKLRRNAN